jgi:hypothetical protein
MGLDDKDGQLMNYLVRMVVPMRREFGRQLDVRHFLHDFAYAGEVIDEALRSQDPRLVDYARYVQQRMHGPRIADTPAPPPFVATPSAPAAPPIEPPAAAGESAEELRAKVLRKYTGGLR